MEPRYTIEQIDLLQRLRLSGMTKPQIIHALESLERLDPDHRPSHCDSQPAPSKNPPTTAAPAPSSSSSSSSSSLSLASATTQTSGLDGAALSPSNSCEASPPPLYPPSVAVQRSFSYDMMGEEEWDLEEKVEEYMRFVRVSKHDYRNETLIMSDNDSYRPQSCRLILHNLVELIQVRCLGTTGNRQAPLNKVSRSKGCLFNHREIVLIPQCFVFCFFFCCFYRRDSNLVKEEIKTFLNNRRISQAIVGQVTGTAQLYRRLQEYTLNLNLKKT